MFDSLFIALQSAENRLVNDFLTEINKVALQCKNKLPFPAL